MEESFETGELKDQLEEALERAEKHGEELASPSWMIQLSLSTALIAVLAAIASLHAGSLANDTILLKNNAVLQQAKASDAWAYYQAKGIKSIVCQMQAENAAGRSGALATHYTQEAKRYKDEQAEIKIQADEIEKKVAEDNDEAAHILHHHHRFALAVTLFQVAIALSAIASLTRRKTMWYGGLLLAAGGVIYFVYGFL